MRRYFCLFVTAILCWTSISRSAEPEAKRLTARDLDALFNQELHSAPKAELITDEQFLRRASLDLIGRQPTPEELRAFEADSATDKRARAIDRLLESKEFGKNWANYWSDTISSRVPQPELTFLSYRLFKAWLADKINGNVHWDAITRDIITANGKLGDNPAVTFIGYHQGNAVRLAAETSRIFMGLQIQCAQCHDHKFDHWKRKQFHQLAAFFARTDGKLPKSASAVQDPVGTLVKDRGKGEHEMPNVAEPRKKGTIMPPAFLDDDASVVGQSDAERRTALARWMTQPANPWFSRAYVNRIWARLMGRGFYDPVDNMADYQKHKLPGVHKALADSFASSGFDIKELFRVVMNTRAYQRQLPIDPQQGEERFFSATTAKLRGDEVFDSLVLAIGLPNWTPPGVKPTGAIRFPPPPKSTCDLVNDKFGFDPSYSPEEVSRSLGQAMLLMNNTQVQAQINADPKSGTLLSKLLQKETDDQAAVTALFVQVLARKPTDREVKISLDHIQTVGKRGEAIEDLLWGLINSAEFTTKR